MKNKYLVNATSLVSRGMNFVAGNLKKISVVVFLLSSLFLKSQTGTSTCTTFNLAADLSHYTVNGSSHDSTFVKYIQFVLSDTISVSKITYTLTNLTSSSQTQQQNYTFNTITSSQNLTVVNNCQRNQKTIKISLGYFNYSGTRYLTNIKLYDSNNILLTSSNFNFNH